MPNFEDLKVGDLVYDKLHCKPHAITYIGEAGDISVEGSAHNQISLECYYFYGSEKRVTIVEKEKEKEDVVNKPAHYNQGKIECIDAIKSALTEQEYIGYLKGTSLKYHWRAKHKGNEAQDMQKAKWYLDRLNKYLTKE